MSYLDVVGPQNQFGDPTNVYAQEFIGVPTFYKRNIESANLDNTFVSGAAGQFYRTSVLTNSVHRGKNPIQPGKGWRKNIHSRFVKYLWPLAKRGYNYLKDNPQLTEPLKKKAREFIDSSFT